MKVLSRIAMTLTLSATMFFAIAAAPSAKKSAAKDEVMPASQMKFEQVLPGISKANLWGNPAKGPYGALTRFTKGTRVDWHTHPYDIKAVVISGTMLYDNGTGEKRLGPGSFVQERSSIKHTTAAAADSDVTFYEEGAGPFGVKMVK
jgi:quercetin dioxygenase-like cupin family protein